MFLVNRDIPEWTRIILNQSQSKNKLSQAFLDHAIEVFDGIHADCHDNSHNCRVVTLESETDSIFAAGADMNELLQLAPESAKDYSRKGQGLMRLVETCPVPVIALVCGPCMGGGLDLALSCHQVLASPAAVFAHPGVYLGIVTGFGGTVRLAEKTNVGFAREKLLTGISFSGLEAHHAGLVSRLFPSGDEMRYFIKKTFL